MPNLLATNPGAYFQTRSGIFVSDANAMLYGVPTGQSFIDLIEQGCIPLDGGKDLSSGIANILNFKFAGENDYSNAFTRALATGFPVVIPYNGGVPYSIGVSYAIQSNTFIYGVGGRPTIHQTKVGRLFNVTGQSNVYIQDIIIDGNKSVVTAGPPIDFETGSFDCQVKNVQFLNCSREIRIFSGSNNIRVEDCQLLNSGQFGIQIDGSTTWGNVVTGCYIDNCASFGIILTNGCYKNEISRNRCYRNGIELIGVTYACWGNRIIGNHSEGTGDNGISITGYQNVCTGNTCIGNANTGIYCYGYNNTISGNFCKNNGQSGGSAWSGISVIPGFGGRGQYNTIVGNTCVDDQLSPTQSYGVQIGANVYPVWTSGGNITQGYYFFGTNVYQGSGTGTAGTTPPTHTSGTVSDGNISWTYLYTGPTNLGAIYNIVAENSCTGNSVKDHADLSANNNTLTGRDHMVRGGASAIRFSANSTPNGNVTGNPGDLAMVVNQAIGMPYFKSSGINSNTGWLPVGAALSGSLASRPTASDGDGLQYWNTDSNRLQISKNGTWLDVATGTPSPDLIAFDYNFGTQTYKESGSSVSLATHFHISRNQTAYLRSAYPSNTITSFSANNARIDPGGRGLFVGSLNLVNYFLNSAAPATQSISLAAGTYYLDIIGSGSATLSGGPTGTATDQNPVAFTLGGTTSVTVTISGSPAHVNLLSGPAGMVDRKSVV